MATLYNRIALLCEGKQVSFTRMLVDIGVSRSLKQKLQDNPEKTITLKTAQKMADYFGVSVDYITGEDTKKEAAPISGSGLPEGYVELTPENRAIVDRLIADLAKSQSKT